MLFRRLMLISILALPNLAAHAAAPVDIFKAAAQLPCVQMEQQISLLQSVTGKYSLAISGRAADYHSMQMQLDQLKLVDVPYSGQDLTPLPPAQLRGIKSEWHQVPRTVAAPQWGLAIGELTLGALFGTLTVGDLLSKQPNDKVVAGAGTLTILLGIGAVTALSTTKTVYDSKYDAQTAAANQQIRNKYAAEKRTIEQKNAERKKKLAQRNAAIAQNQKISDQRSSIINKMSAFEQQSTNLAAQRINTLSEATNRRCLERLVYEGSAVRLGTRQAYVYLIVRPLNPSNQALADASSIPGLTFGVATVTLSDPLGQVAFARQPAVAAVVPAAKAPVPGTAAPGSLAVEVEVGLQNPVARPKQLSIDATVEARQEGRTFTARATGDHIRLLP